MSKQINIGFIIGPQGIKWQDTYYDKFMITKKRPWLADVPSKYHIDDEGKSLPSTHNGKRYVRIDVAVAYCVKSLLQKNVDIIPIEKLDVNMMNKYDIICNQYMDLLIVPFMKKFETKGFAHEKLRLMYEQHKDKIYPPVNYENLIYNKCDYYAYLELNGIPVPKTLCISRHDFDVSPREVNSIIQQFVVHNNYDKLFAKPVGGTDSIDIKQIDIRDKVKMNKEVSMYLKNIFSQKRYPQVVIQPYIKEFETTVPQVRMYFLGNTLKYSILNTRDKPDERVTSKHPMHNTVMKKLLPLSRKVLRLMNPYFKGYSKLVTRIDFGCCIDNKSFFVNEIEFAPGMYLHMDNNKFNMDYHIAKQFVKVVNEYKKNRQAFS